MGYFTKRFSAGQLAGLMSVVLLWAAASAYAQVTIPNTFSSGASISSSQVNANFTALKNAVDPLLVSNHVQFENLNFSSTNVTSTYTKIPTTATAHTFTKSRADTKVEVHVNSRFSGGAFSGAFGVLFQVRIDDLPTTLADNLGSVVASNTSDFLSIYAVFQGLAAGSHTVSLWARTNAGTSTGVLVDPSGFGGAIIVKEA